MNTSKAKENSFRILFMMTAIISIFAVIAIFVFLFLKGLPAFQKIGFLEFIFGDVWNSNSTDTFVEELTGQYGILTMIVGTIFSTVGALLVGGVLGFFTAVFLARFCPKRLKKTITALINLLAGIPSVVYGFFGMKVLLPLLGNFSPNGDGSGLLATSLILGIMILPTIVALSKTAIEAVPDSYYEGARALGANKEQAVYRVLVPAAKSGILASFILGIGRAIGETMAVVMVAGNSATVPNGLFASFRTLTANVVLEMGYAGEVQMSALIATGVVLLFFIVIINMMFNLALNRKRKTTPKKPMVTSYVSGKLKLEKVYKVFGYVSVSIATFSLLAIVGFILVKGIPYINSEFLFSDFTYGGAVTIFPSIVATIMLVFLCIVIALPIGIMTAIYLNEYTKRGNKLVKIIRSAVEILSGIPSIVYGLFGMIFFCGVLNLGTSILAGALTVSIMLLPTIVRATEESLKAVPDSYREGSLALGAGKLRTIIKVVLPSALPGIMSAVILSIGRVVSESAPLVFTMGASLKPLPKNGFLSGGTSLAVALYKLAGEGLHVNEAYATACVLIFIVLVLNALSSLIEKLLSKKVGVK